MMAVCCFPITSASRQPSISTEIQNQAIALRARDVAEFARGELLREVTASPRRRPYALIHVDGGRHLQWL